MVFMFRLARWVAMVDYRGSFVYKTFVVRNATTPTFKGP